MNVTIYGGDTLKGFISSIEFSFRSEIEEPLLGNCQLVIIENKFIVGDSFINGKELIFRLRLKYKFTKPIILLYDLEPPKADEKFIEVVQDPYVILMEFEDLVDKYSDSMSLLKLFDPIQSIEDVNLLYRDLRQTIYREGGYLSEVKHSILNQLSELDTKELQKSHKLIERCSIETDRILAQWRMKSLSREAVKESFNKCYELSHVEEIKKQVNQVFREIEMKISIKKTEKRTPIVEDIKVLYISDSEENRDELTKLFHKNYTTYHIICIGVSRLADAKTILKKDERISIVLTDYRFWKASNKISKINSYHIIKNLKIQFPSLFFALFTNFPEYQIVKPPDLENIEIFNKREAFSERKTEFHRLTKIILQHNELVLAARGIWPKGLSAKEDQIWKAAFEERFLQHKDVYILEQKIGHTAINITTRLLDGDRNVVYKIPKVSARLSLVKKNILQALINRLIVRRVIIGLYNSPNLRSKFQYLLPIERKYKKKIKEHELRFEIIYQLLKSHGEPVDLPLRKVISNFFNDNFRIRISKVYFMKIEGLLEIITLAEHRWLITQYHKLS